MLNNEESERLRVILIRSRNPLNIGAVARAMVNFGFPHLRVVEPYDVAFREARSAVSAESVLARAQEFADVGPAIADCSIIVGTTDGHGRTPTRPLLGLQTAANRVRERLRAGENAAVLFGSEKVGLSNRDLSHCDLLLRIPTRTEHPSMNLGQAAAVVLYELARVAKVSGSEGGNRDEARMTAGDRERLVAALAEAVRRSGRPKGADWKRAVLRAPGTNDFAEEQARRLVRQLQGSPADAHEWLGILRRMLWRLEHGGEQNGEAPHI